MDFGYFERYFRLLESNKDPERTLTIITKDEISRIELLDNIRRMDISVRDIFAHVKVDFLLTDLLNKGDKDEQKRFNVILEQLQNMTLY